MTKAAIWSKLWNLFDLLKFLYNGHEHLLASKSISVFLLIFYVGIDNIINSYLWNYYNTFNCMKSGLHKSFNLLKKNGVENIYPLVFCEKYSQWDILFVHWNSRSNIALRIIWYRIVLFFSPSTTIRLLAIWAKAISNLRNCFFIVGFIRKIHLYEPKKKKKKKRIAS